MTLSLQFSSLLLMVLSGVLIGAIIEMTRFLTGIFPRRSVVFKYGIGIEVIVWLLLGFGTFYLLYIVRDGIWRVYDPLAQMVGIILYEQIFQPVFRLAGRIFVRLIVKPIWFILYTLIMIIRKILHFFVLIIGAIVHPLLFPIKKIWHLALQKKQNIQYNIKHTKNLKKSDGRERNGK
ncbi:spore cortex biosynthesis protein YabQ [Psychrobacillus sp.]|uniref:spore cortex biosynthesis protein YabQ n=1 Tax=Psychrobacillus sp. TaxID=1871623 RepID=UPI0028BEDC9D|nr:spore cortex biosynthesis protein YabQ [Psychrobacillus sp.]